MTSWWRREMMGFATRNPSYGLRHWRRVVLVLFINTHLVLISQADANAICMRIEQLQAVIDLKAKQQIEDHIASKFASRDQKIRKLENNVYLVGPTSAACRTSCVYHLVRLVDDLVTELFALHTSGWILLSTSQFDLVSEQFGIFNLIIFETPEKLYVGVGLLRSGNSVLVETIPRESGRVWRCN